MDMPNIELNETVSIEGTNTEIMKVPGGWIYKFHYPVYTPVGAQYEDHRMQAVFVPNADNKQTERTKKCTKAQR